MPRTHLEFSPADDAQPVSAILDRPDDARLLLVFAHGAGAGMEHSFMESMSQSLNGHGVATFRYQFPYMQKGSRRPDRPPLLTSTVRSAVAAAAGAAGDLPMIAGGKSMGGRMTSMAQSQEPLPGVTHLVFFGFPLHPAGKPSTDRAEHLYSIRIPMLFLQGTRDTLADLELLEPVIAKLGNRATLHIVDGADHGFHVLKRSGRTDEEVIEEMSRILSDWPSG